MSATSSALMPSARSVGAKRRHCTVQRCNVPLSSKKRTDDQEPPGSPFISTSSSAWLRHSECTRTRCSKSGLAATLATSSLRAAGSGSNACTSPTNCAPYSPVTPIQPPMSSIFSALGRGVSPPGAAAHADSRARRAASSTPRITLNVSLSQDCTRGEAKTRERGGQGGW